MAAFLVIAGTVLRGVAVHRMPLGNMYEFGIVTASFVLLIYCAWALRTDLLWLGLFIVFPVLVGLIGTKLLYTEPSQLMPALDHAMWLSIHVSLATLATALFAVGAALAALFLLKDSRQRKDKTTGWLLALPETGRLEQLTYMVHVVAFPLWTGVLITGAIWAEVAWGRYWGWDPKETWTFVIWVVYAAYLHARVTTTCPLRRATWLVIAGIICVLINYGAVNLLFSGLHSYSGVST